MNVYRLLAIATKEFRQLGRDRLTFGMVVMIPLVQLLLFGFAINTNVRNIPVGVTDLSETTAGRLIAATAEATGVVDITHHYPTPQQAQKAIAAGEVSAVLVLPNDLSNRLVRGDVVGQWMVDGSDSLVSSALLGLANMPLDQLIPEPSAERHISQPTFATSIFYNPERRTAVNIVPGLVGVILTMTMIMFTSAAIVRERERGNMELLITTPVRPMELMLGKIIPYVVIGFIQTAIILQLGHWVFDVPISGGIIALCVITLVFIGASLTLGLILSTIAKTQLQAMQMTIFVLLPSILLSGFMFPYQAMPVAAQWVAEALPATHYMRLIRAVVLRDAALGQLTFDLCWLAAFTVVGLIIASLRFKKRLD
jgi:ABC-2 type transport system permease protein